MNPKLRKFLEENGLRSGASEQEALEYYRALQGEDVKFSGPETIENGGDGQRVSVGEGVPTPAGSAPAQPVVVPPAPATIDRAAAAQQGFQRGLEIVGLCERFGIPTEERSELLKPEVTLEQARKMVLEKMAEHSQQSNPGFRPEVRVGVEDIDKYRASACAGLYLRAGLTLADDRNLAGLISRGGFTLDTVVDAGREFMGYSLRELARESLRRSGQSYGGDPLEMIGRAMTASDLPILMANVANKSLYEGYQSAPETWDLWADGTGSVPDFKTNTLASISEFDDLDTIVNDSGYKYGDRSDAKETYALATYGKLSAITRTVVVNDDLGAMVHCRRPGGGNRCGRGAHRR